MEVTGEILSKYGKRKAKSFNKDTIQKFFAKKMTRRGAQMPEKNVGKGSKKGGWEKVSTLS